ncbi:MAG: N-methyl-L-tryptophan oxidase [Xanthobacteraceae bacterium]
MAAYDVAIVGLGIIGSAALYSLARRGCRVVGIDRYEPGHDRGSSHGETRIFRLGYFEHPSYVPLLREARDLWRALENESGRKLLTTTGIVEIGPPDGELVRGTIASSKLHSLPHEVLTARDLKKRFPAFAVPSDYVGVFQPDGGFLFAEPAIKAQIDLAVAAGAQVQANLTATAIRPHDGEVHIATSGGEIAARTAIIAAGPWLSTVLPQLRHSLRVTRQVLGWLSPPSPSDFAADRFPVFLFESPLGIHYGFPIHGSSGLKISKHHHLDETVDPEAVDCRISPHDEAAILSFRDQFLPSAKGPLTAATTCLYTMTPDSDFIIDRLPDAPQVIVASPCSGHGFKFAPIIGEILADLATSGSTRRDISRFRLPRLYAG